jgi:hypothetical protein
MAEPVSTSLLIGTVAAPIIGGLVGNLMGAKDRRAARKRIEAAIQELKAAGFPPDLSTPILFEKFQEIGIMTPELEQDIQVAASSVAKLEEDPTVRASQLEALNIFKQMGKTGFGPEERAAFNQLRQQRESDLQSRLASQELEARRRGVATAGDTRAQQLLSIQAGADRASLEGDRISAMIAQRIKEGASGMSSVASQMRGQDFQAELARTQADDERKRFIDQNTMSRQARNVDALRDAQRRREQQAMQVGTANTQMANAERLRQVDAQRQFWSDKLSRAQALGNAYTGQASQLQKDADRTAGIFQGIGSGVGQGLGAYAQSQASQNKTQMQAAAEGLEWDGTKWVRKA